MLSVRSLFGLLSAAAILFDGALAAPGITPATVIEEKHALAARGVTTISASQLASYAPYTQFARAAYCGSSVIQNWKCGQACSAIPDFQLVQSGGDGNDVPYWYIGWWPSQSSVVVAHEGTDPTQLLSLLTDADAFLTDLSSSIFPGVVSSAQAHMGFLNAQASSATAVLTQVKSLLSKHSATKVVTIGHSLGGAVAQLDALMLKRNLPSSISIKSMTYGTPRVGNPDYAHFFDTQGIDYTRLDNEDDIIPIVPGRDLGYLHPAGEQHILSAGHVVACPGDDDATDSQCQIQSVPNILVGNILNHLGPYQGIYIGTIYCY